MSSEGKAFICFYGCHNDRAVCHVRQQLRLVPLIYGCSTEITNFFCREGGTLNCDHWESASALLCPQGWLSSWSPTALCVPQGMLSLSPAEMFLLCPAGMLSLSLQGCSVLGQQDLGAVAVVGPSHTLPQLQQFLQAAPCKGSDRHGKVSRRIEHLTVICLTKCYRLQCLTPGYGRNPGKRDGKGNKEGS